MWDCMSSIKESGMKPQYQIAEFRFVIKRVVIPQTLE